MTATVETALSWDAAEELMERRKPGYQRRPPQRLLATTISECLASSTALAAQAGTGCIQGDATIVVNRAGNSRRMKLSSVVARLGGADRHLSGRRWDPSIPTYVQREVNGVIRMGLLKAAWFSGVKRTFTVTTETGRTIRATDEHPFLTERGWCRLDELVVGDLVHTQGQQALDQQVRKPKPRYKQVKGMEAHPYAYHYVSPTRRFSRVPVHRLVAEARLNDLDYQVFVDKVRAGNVDGLEFLDPAVWAVHHDDRCSTNNAPENLMVLTHEQHHRLHAEEGNLLQVLYKVAHERVVSVEPHGEEETFDIEVADDPHNFLANGFVVHNTGKSIGYLVPALLSGLTAIVATATINLQNQLVGQDLPVLADTLEPLLGRRPTYALQMGKGNYLCQAKLAESPRVEHLDELVSWAGKAEELGHTGTLTEVPEGLIAGPQERTEVTTNSDECPGRSDCPFGEVCFAYLAKDRAREADVVVVNHALLATDLATASEEIDEITQEPTGRWNHGVLPEYDVVIVDEAHNFAEYTTNMLGAKITQRSIDALVAQAHNVIDDDTLGRVMTARGRDLFATLADAMRAGRDDTVALTETMLGEIEDYLVEIVDDLDDVRKALSKLPRAEPGSPDVSKRARLRKRIDGLRGKLGVLSANLDVAHDSGEVVRWVQRELFRGQVKITVGYTPLDVSGFLAERLWSQATGVLTSATLRPGGDEHFIPRQLGLTGYRTLDVGSPFDYPTQAGLLVHDRLNPKQEPELWATGGNRATLELIEAAGGGALLLFTSRREMEKRHRAISDAIEDMGYTVLLQEQGKPTGPLGEAKKNDPTSVLFGLKSFMEGFDAPGDAVRLVIIDKMPFTPPGDVVNDARKAKINEALAARRGCRPAEIPVWDEESAFYTLDIPNMLLTLEQAFGRLIRTVTDTGVVAIFDNRMSPRKDAETGRVIGTKYGRKIYSRMPPARSLRSMKETVRFLERTSA